MLVDFCCVLYRVESYKQAAGSEVVVVESVVDAFQKHHFLQCVIGYGKAVRQRLLCFHRAFGHYHIRIDALTLACVHIHSQEVSERLIKQIHICRIFIFNWLIVKIFARHIPPIAHIADEFQPCIFVLPVNAEKLVRY